MITKEVRTFQSRIYIAGDYQQAKQICRKFCDKGFCVSISRVDYIYTHGEESGLEIKIINYPRFERKPLEIKSESTSLAQNLLYGLHQGSLSIVFDDETVFMSRREKDQN